MMVEVFKTNVNKRRRADLLVNEIHKAFIGHHANFDLEDCDNILRVQCNCGTVQAHLLIDFLKRFDCTAEVLED